MPDKPIRIQRRRAKGWRLPKNTVCVDRSTQWGNPFIVGRDGTRVECVKLYATLMAGYIALTCDAPPEAQQKHRDYVMQNLGELRGRNLACWCSLPAVGENDVCHGAVLLTLANERKVNVDG
jgi:Domain of unknown function (DUF4326)